MVPASGKLAIKTVLPVGCHNAVHDGSALGTLLKVECQMVFELEHSREEFMKIIGRNYLDD